MARASEVRQGVFGSIIWCSRDKANAIIQHKHDPPERPEVVLANPLGKIRAVVFDLDGTVYEGDDLVNGVLEAIETLQCQGYKIYYCTNNSTRSREDIAGKLLRLGIVTTKGSIYSAAYAAAHYLSNSDIERVSLLGTSGLRDELGAAGLTVVDGLDSGQALVVGLDPSIDYSKMASLATLLNKNMPVIACNRDKWFPGDKGVLKPGCGIMIALVEELLGRKVTLVAGKPNTLLLEILSQQSGFSKDELLIVGDSLESDIALAEAFGSPWILYAPHGKALGQRNSIATMNELPGCLLK